MKKKMIVSIVLMLSLLGCRDPFNDHGLDYPSDVVAIYNDATHHRLLFLGKKYDYVFNVGDNLASVIGAKEYLGYRLQRDTMIQDDLNLLVKILSGGHPQLVAFILLDGSKLDQGQIDWMLDHGFEAAKKKTPDGNQQYAFNAQIIGARYAAKGAETLELLQELEDGEIVLRGRDYSYTPNPSVDESPIEITQDGVRYNGEDFIPSPL